jgi:hypothetical protein
VSSAAVLNYVTESAYDTVMWQKVQAKALFIEQMRRNEVLDTEIEGLFGGDIGSAAAETKAVATLEDDAGVVFETITCVSMSGLGYALTVHSV